jgi:hypothetical protein
MEKPPIKGRVTSETSKGLKCFVQLSNELTQTNDEEVDPP